MKIAQIAPLAESVPPRLYGGTERVVSYLTEELVAQGHDVTLFASGDSQTAARLVPCAPTALRLDPAVRDPLPLPPPHARAGAPARAGVRHPALPHRPDALPARPHLRHALGDDAARPPRPAGPHALLPRSSPTCRWSPSPTPSARRCRPSAGCAPSTTACRPTSTASRARPAGGYLAFLGRISPEKRPDRAIDIATRAGIPLRIAAKIDNVDAAYWRDEIEPLVRGNPLVEFVGEIGERDKADFLGNATALLFPIDWPEPFGLVMIEAMACGTPVIAFPPGAAPEVVDHGVTGFLVTSIAEATAAVVHAARLDRARVRAAFERRFSIERVAEDYLEVYLSLCGQGRTLRPPGDLPLIA